MITVTIVINCELVTEILQCLHKQALKSVCRENLVLIYT